MCVSDGGNKCGVEYIKIIISISHNIKPPLHLRDRPTILLPERTRLRRSLKKKEKEH